MRIEGRILNGRPRDSYRSIEYKFAVLNGDMRMLHGTFAAAWDTRKLRSMVEDRLYYRVNILKGFVEVLSFEMEDVDDPLNGMYDDLSDLPDWMQERVAMLSMLSFQPPTELVEGVGRRISEFTYWVEKPDS